MKHIFTPKDYFNRFNEIRNDFSSDRKAYYALEHEYKDRYGTVKYVSFDSFRVQKTYHTKRRFKK